MRLEPDVHGTYLQVKHSDFELFVRIVTFRESCGVCGFLSVENEEEQEVAFFNLKVYTYQWCVQVDGKSYTDFSKESFDCGRYKPLCVIQGSHCNIKSPPPPTRSKRDLIDWDFWPEYPLDENNNGYFCSATIISDRWAVAGLNFLYNFFVKI